MPRKQVTKKDQSARLRKSVAFIVEKGAEVGLHLQRMDVAAADGAVLAFKVDYQGAETLEAAIKLALGKQMLTE